MVLDWKELLYKFILKTVWVSEGSNVVVGWDELMGKERHVLPVVLCMLSCYIYNIAPVPTYPPSSRIYWVCYGVGGANNPLKTLR